MVAGGRSSVFDPEADRYATARPTYPEALFDRLAAFGDLRSGARVLEVGPGTGQATLAMARRGWAVTAIELGPQLARAARSALAGFPAVQVVEQAFEEWPPPERPVDAYLCATAFHWLDPAVRVVKAAATLRTGGTLALVTTHHVAGGTEDFFRRAQACYERWEPGVSPGLRLPAEDDVPAGDDDVRASPSFADVAVHRFPQEIRYTTAEYLDLVRTYSPTLALPEERRTGLLACLRQLIDDCGGRITKRYLFELLLARRSSTPTR